MRQRQVVRLRDADEIASVAAERMLRRMAGNASQISICLSGGSTPRKLYELLASERYRSQVPWERIQWFIGDERLVDQNDPRSNIGMIGHAFLDECAPAANVHAIPTDVTDPDTAARRYEATLKSFYGSAQLDPAQPLFDIVLLGIGPDGHTASLFPGYAAVREEIRWVVGVPEANVEPFVPRISLTLPALKSCREMLFLVSGQSKRSILSRALEGDDLPASQARSLGETVWLCDFAALPEDGHG